MSLWGIDSTIVCSLIALVGTIFTIINNKNTKKQDTIIQTNEQLITMLKTSQEEIRSLKEQHVIECHKLEEKIALLTKENQALNEKVNKLNNYLTKLGITI